ncbi:MAG: hypothetical protein ACUVRO_13540 [Armatimonadota bacterium]
MSRQCAHNLEQLENRVAQAERQLRAMRFGAFALLVLAGTARAVQSSWARIAGTTAAGPARPATMLRTPVQVVDATGNVLLLIDSSGGHTDLIISSPDGTRSLRIVADKTDGGSVSVLNSNGAAVASLARTSKSGVLLVTDIDGKLGAELGATGLGGELDLYSKAGIRAVGLGCTDLGGGLTLFAKGGQPMIGLGVTDQGGGMTVWDKGGKAVYSAP